MLVFGTISNFFSYSHTDAAATRTKKSVSMNVDFTLCRGVAKGVTRGQVAISNFFSYSHMDAASTRTKKSVSMNVDFKLCRGVAKGVTRGQIA